jgi:hypothetical protein
MLAEGDEIKPSASPPVPLRGRKANNKKKMTK